MLKGLSFIVLSYLYKVKLLRTSSFSVTLHRIDCATAKITNELVSLLSVRTILAQNITP